MTLKAPQVAQLEADYRAGVPQSVAARGIGVSGTTAFRYFARFRDRGIPRGVVAKKHKPYTLKKAYVGPVLIGKQITMPPLGVGPQWIGKRIGTW